MTVPSLVSAGTPAASSANPLSVSYVSTAVLENDVALLAGGYLGGDEAGTTLDGVFDMFGHANQGTTFSTFGAWKLCAGGEEDDAINVDVTSGSVQKMLALVVFRGVLADADPANGTEGVATASGTGNTATAADIVTTGVDRLGVIITGHRGANQEGSVPDGWTRVVSYYDAGSGRNLQVYTKTIATASTEPGPAVVYGGGTTNSWAALSFALIPAAAGSGTVFTEVLSDSIAISDEPLSHNVYSRLLESPISVTDELLASVVGTAIISRVLSDEIAVTDGNIWWSIRNRLLQDSITLSEGPTETYTTSNLLASDDISIGDSAIKRLWFTRLLDDAFNLSDEAVASYIGQNVLTRILTSEVSTSDEAVYWLNRYRTGESSILTADEVARVLLWTRQLTDTIDAADESLSAMQRFILLTDALSVDDSATALYVPPGEAAITNPVIRTGFDQPRIRIGGYAI